MKIRHSQTGKKIVLFASLVNRPWNDRFANALMVELSQVKFALQSSKTEA
jgi:hypothetical protein